MPSPDDRDEHPHTKCATLAEPAQLAYLRPLPAAQRPPGHTFGAAHGAVSLTAEEFLAVLTLVSPTNPVRPEVQRVLAHLAEKVLARRDTDLGTQIRQATNLFLRLLEAYGYEQGLRPVDRQYIGFLLEDLVQSPLTRQATSAGT